MTSAFPSAKPAKDIQAVLSGGYTLSQGAGGYIQSGLALIQKNPSVYIGAAVLIFALSALPTLLDVSVLKLATLIVMPPLTASIYIVGIRLVKGEQTDFPDLLEGFQQFVPLVLASIVGSLLVILGLICLIVPGIYLATSYSLVQPLIIDRRLGFWSALETSRKIVTKNWWSFFGLSFLIGLIFGLLSLVILIPVVLILGRDGGQTIIVIVSNAISSVGFAVYSSSLLAMYIDILGLRD